MWILDSYCSKYGNEMLQKTLGHLIHPLQTRNSIADDYPSHWSSWWPAHYREKVKTEMVQSRHPIIRPCKNYPARHCARRQKWQRQKKRCEDNIQEWTCFKLSESVRAAEDRERWTKLVNTSSVYWLMQIMQVNNINKVTRQIIQNVRQNQGQEMIKKKTGDDQMMFNHINRQNTGNPRQQDQLTKYFVVFILS